ncbi:MAG: TonB-dependent receptor, partial [Rhodothermales bacterium]
APLEQTVSHTYEVGYKGLFGRRVLVAVDGYYATKRNFVGPLLVESPFVLAPERAAVISDLEGAMAVGIAGNAQLAGALQQLGLPPALVAGLIISLARSNLETSLPAPNSPIGIVQPAENAIPGQLLLSYRNFGDLSYYGLDASTEVLVNDRLSLFGNMSWVSDNFFDDEELDEEGTSLELSMNAPKIKLKGGFDYSVPFGVRVNAAVRYVDSFIVRSGPYEGEVPSYTILDVGAGYDLGRFAPGLRADVAVLNVFDEMHREFIGAPQMGRLAIGRLTYTIE